VRAWVIYSLLRVGLFVVLFTAMLLLGVVYWVAAVAAAIIALCISYIFFGRLRGRVAEEFTARRAAGTQPPRADSDEGAEDAVDSERDRGSES
jgi:uncharacterized membrane protein YphA (DoxX/SURF4 family)